MNLINFYYLANKLHRKGWKGSAKCLYYLQYLIFNSSVPPTVKIGKSSVFAYGGIGCVIHKNAQIGDNCTLGQGITIGGKSKQSRVPVIGNHVYIGAGARILGAINIGNNVIIGPNAVVTKDVEDNCIVVGIPAKVLKRIDSIYDHI